jgi:hypothetical protein
MCVPVPEAQVAPVPYTVSSWIDHQLGVFTPTCVSRTYCAALAAKPMSMSAVTVAQAFLGIEVFRRGNRWPDTDSTRWRRARWRPPDGATTLALPMEQSAVELPWRTENVRLTI